MDGIKLFETEKDDRPRADEGLWTERISVDYRDWLKQKTEITALRFLVGMQLLGIIVMAVAIGYLLFRGY